MVLPPWPDLELHNIAELDSAAACPGRLLRRYPRAVAERLEFGGLVSAEAALSELRFVAESGRRIALALTSLSGADLFVYCGDFVQNHVRLPAGALHRLVLELEPDLLTGLTPFAPADAPRGFSPRVWRVILDGPVLLHGIDRIGSVLRGPRPDEKPARRWLAYGSSITQGYTPVTRQQCYIAQTARRLRVDAINLGLAGSCLCEPAAVDYLASRDDWDFITCEVGVNMRAHHDPEIFSARVRHLVTTLLARRPGRPVVLISPFPSAADHRLVPDTAALRTTAYRAALEHMAREFAPQGVHLIDGRELLPDFAGLTCDLVHPSTEGHALIAEHLAARLRALGLA